VAFSLLNRWMSGDSTATDASAAKMQAQIVKAAREREGEASGKAMEKWKMSTAEQRALERELMNAMMGFKRDELKASTTVAREDMQNQLRMAQMGAQSNMGVAGMGAMGGLGQSALQTQALLSNPDAGSSWTQNLPQPMSMDTNFQMGGGY
jgi:hypothetical protein